MPVKATVIEAQRDRAIVMNERCEFVTVRMNRPLQTGETVEYLPRDVVSARRFPLRYAAMAASLIIFCVVSLSVFKYMAAGEVYAFVGLDINPSLEMGISRDGRVVSLTAYNGEGEKIINTPGLLKSDLHQALDVVISRCRENNYLREGQPNFIAVSVYTPGKNSGPDLMSRIDRELNTGLEKSGVTASTYFFTINSETREKAGEQKTSATNYLLWEKARRSGLPVELRDITLKNPAINVLVREARVKGFGHAEDEEKGVRSGQHPGNAAVMNSEEPTYSRSVEVDPAAGTINGVVSKVKSKGDNSADGLSTAKSGAYNNQGQSGKEKAKDKTAGSPATDHSAVLDRKQPAAGEGPAVPDKKQDDGKIKDYVSPGDSADTNPKEKKDTAGNQSASDTDKDASANSAGDGGKEEKEGNDKSGNKGDSPGNGGAGKSSGSGGGSNSGGKNDSPEGKSGNAGGSKDKK